MNLTEASKNIKIGLKIVVGLIAAYYIFIFYLFPRVRNYVRRLIPQRDPPNIMYGELPALNFEQKKTSNSDVKYELNTTGGRLPGNFPLKMTVYKFISPQFSYLAGKNAEKDAGQLGFTEKNLISDLKGNVYKWRDINTGSTLAIQINSRELIMDTPYENITTSISQPRVREDHAITESVKIFKNLERYTDELYKDGKKKVVLGVVAGTHVIEARNTDIGNVAKVDIFKKIGDYHVVTPDYTNGLLSIVFSPISLKGSPVRNPKVTGIFWDVDTKSEGTYPIIFVDEAWDRVKNGKGVISTIVPSGGNRFESYEPVRVEKIIVNDIYLAYYETPQFQLYLQPVYVFEGKYSTRGTDGGEVVVYYPAVDPKFIKPANTGQ